MKFLILGKPKDIVLTVPAAMVRQMMEASFAARSRQKKEGKMLEDYIIAGESRPVFIYECRTAEELMKELMEAPISLYMEFEIYPLADFSIYMHDMIEKLKIMEHQAVGSTA